MDVGHELFGEFLPACGVGVLFCVVEVGTASTGGDVDYAFGAGVLVAVEGLVEGPLARDFGVLAEDKAGSDFEGEGVGALVVVDVAGEDEVDFAFFKDVGENADALLFEVDF